FRLGAARARDAQSEPEHRRRNRDRVAFARDSAYIGCAGLRCASDKYSRGLTILKGAVPGRARGLGPMAPTYFCRFPGSKSDGSGGSALSFTFTAGSSFRPRRRRPMMRSTRTEHLAVSETVVGEEKAIV